MEIISHTLPRSAHRITTDDTVICRTFPKRRSLNTARSFDRQYCNTSMPLSLGSSSSSSPSVKRTESTKYSDGLFRGCFSKLNRRNIVTRNQQPVSKNIYKGWSFYHCKEIIIIIFCYLGFHIIGFFYVLICIGLDCLCCILWVPPPPPSLCDLLSRSTWLPIMMICVCPSLARNISSPGLGAQFSGKLSTNYELYGPGFSTSFFSHPVNK